MGSGGPSRYVIGGGRVANKSLTFLPVCDWDACEIIPTRPQCPARAFIAEGRRLSANLGISAIQSGDADTILRYAANHAFWQLPLATLEKLAREKDVWAKGYDLYAVVKALVVNILDPSKERLGEILALRGVAPRDDKLELLSEELVGDVLGKGEVDQIEVLRSVGQTKFFAVALCF